MKRTFQLLINSKISGKSETVGLWGMSAWMCTQSFVALRCILGILRELIPTTTRTTRVAFWDPPSVSKNDDNDNDTAAAAVLLLLLLLLLLLVVVVSWVILVPVVVIVVVLVEKRERIQSYCNITVRSARQFYIYTDVTAICTENEHYNSVWRHLYTVSSVPLVSFFLKFVELKLSLVVELSLLPCPKYGMIYPFLADTHHH